MMITGSHLYLLCNPEIELASPHSSFKCVCGNNSILLYNYIINDPQYPGNMRKKYEKKFGRFSL